MKKFIEVINFYRLLTWLDVPYERGY